MRTIEISIIVPVYNLENLLPRCVESILAQTFKNFELILVNDGSTDQSGELCEKYAEKDLRVKVIHKENGGVASSRNAGLAAAKGRYIGFVDNDDCINKNMFEILYKNLLKYDSDIAICEVCKVNEGELIDIENFHTQYKVQQFNNIEALNYYYLNTNDATFIYPWNKLYKRDLFENLQYEVGNIYDDETVAHHLFYTSNKIIYVRSELYYYVQRKGSQINSPFSIKKFGRIYALKNREVFFRKKKEHELHQKALKHYMDTFFWYYYTAKSSLKGIDHELKQLKRTFDKSCFHLLQHKELSWKQKLMCVLFSISPNLFEFVKEAGNKKTQSNM
ncbi:glycosyltransferase family 2 protein [Siminovitchia sediminis]|uniref:Glycosyltransferase family 2 protein n=1 Tax=Siminovitchia sediminis TaxID=1274353 RepID=A0ABW4KFI6_9BACI